MLELNINQAGESIILTLDELKTLDTPYYLFIFSHVETKLSVSFIKSQADDQSDYPSRYNQFLVDTSTVFQDKPTGEWHYAVYEQAGAVNTDPTLATGLLEKGKLMLRPAAGFEYEMYNNSTTYKAYNG
jgi:hypothetical protein